MEGGSWKMVGGRNDSMRTAGDESDGGNWEVDGGSVEETERWMVEWMVGAGSLIVEGR